MKSALICQQFSWTVTDFWCCYGFAPPTQRTILGTPCLQVTPHNTAVPNYTHIRSFTTSANSQQQDSNSEFPTAHCQHFNSLPSCTLTMSEYHSHTMSTPQQCSIIVRPQQHCTTWQLASLKYVSRPSPEQQRKSHSSTHRAQPIQTKQQWHPYPRSSTTAWHSRRQSPSRLGLVDHATSRISHRTQIGPVQVVPAIYRRHLARLIIRIGTRSEESS